MKAFADIVNLASGLAMDWHLLTITLITLTLKRKYKCFFVVRGF